MRLQKYIALCGISSRRKAEQLIIDGKVMVNNKVITELGTTIDPNKDVVKVDNKKIKAEKNKVYIMLNKPIGFVTTLKDEKDRKIVTDLIEGVKERIYPVGRLDADTTGLLLLTNDGDMAYKLTHPSNEIMKKYIAIVEGVPNKAELEKFRRGLVIDGKKTSNAYIKIAKRYDTESILEIVIHEGRNRQVKKMCEAINHPVKKLKRVSIGEIQIGGLDIGNWRYLDDEEIKYLRSI
ncbi:pseudouridine synthase [Tissierella sp. MB52-C2]|uniref:pseudouridine synthase n=1 Tax=Tissierella sp. MB52-C2 TaxID=3070999 RepID=UPI00280BBD3F|nr:pseudouridine synthase [Tissierella sp. MB52-C2]WMM26491.1 pseudouridine synthase [Tissierella sp. MB52-C2]